MKKLILSIIILFVTLNANAQNDIQIKKLEQIINFISSNYIDSVNVEKLTEAAISGIMSQLDPHSIYTDAKITRDTEEKLSGNLIGIGIKYSFVLDTLFVVQVVDKGPADKAGIVSCDKIIKINDQNITGDNARIDNVKNLFKSNPDDLLEITFLRDKKEKTVKIKRNIVELKSVDGFFNVNDSIGYIKISYFGNTTAQEVSSAINNLSRNRIRNLIIDLQNNAGGYLSSAVNLCGKLFPAGKLVVSMKSKNAPAQNFLSPDIDNDRSRINKIIILVNENTASAAEIVAGAVQDWDRGLIVGRRTFGKGVVQYPFRLIDDSEIRLTSAKYFTPSGRCIQKMFSSDYLHEIKNRNSTGELFNADSIKVDSSQVFFTLNRHRKIFGSSGIIPDIFVAADSTQMPSIFTKNDLIKLLNEFPALYIAENKKEILKNYKTFEKFKTKYVVDNKVFDEIYDFYQNYCVNPQSNKIDKQEYYNKINDSFKKAIIIKIKEEIAHCLYGENAYVEISALSDKIYNESLKYIK